MVIELSEFINKAREHYKSLPKPSDPKVVFYHYNGCSEDVCNKVVNELRYYGLAADVKERLLNVARAVGFERATEVFLTDLKNGKCVFSSEELVGMLSMIEMCRHATELQQKKNQGLENFSDYASSVGTGGEATIAKGKFLLDTVRQSNEILLRSQNLMTVELNLRIQKKSSDTTIKNDPHTTPKTKNIPQAKTDNSLDSYYPYKNRYHLFPVMFKGKSGDLAKREILQGYKNQLDNIQSIEDLNRFVRFVIDDPKYRLLKEGQGMFTTVANLLFHMIKTSSECALEQMIEDKRNSLRP